MGAGLVHSSKLIERRQRVHPVSNAMTSRTEKSDVGQLRHSLPAHVEGHKVVAFVHLGPVRRVTPVQPDATALTREVPKHPSHRVDFPSPEPRIAFPYSMEPVGHAPFLVRRLILLFIGLRSGRQPCSSQDSARQAVDDVGAVAKPLPYGHIESTAVRR